MCDMIDSQSAEKISRMKKLRRTLSESFGRIALKKEDSSFDEKRVVSYKRAGTAGKSISSLERVKRRPVKENWSILKDLVFSREGKMSYY